MPWALVASVLGFLAVALGAFGAHALGSRLDPKALEVFKTATHYHFFHSIVLFVLGLLQKNHLPTATSSWFPYACWAFFFGILVFSGSLYLLSITGLRWLGAITPIGGVSFLLGWVFLALTVRH